MGEIKRKRRKFSRPRKLFDRKRIDEENVIVRDYGLKNKREIWKAKAVVSGFRKRAKELINGTEEERKTFFEKLNRLGIVVSDVSDVLALTEKDLLDRRLQTFVFKKELANTPSQARQLIVHKHVLVEGAIVNIPSFWISLDLEDKISVKEKKVKVKEAEVAAPEEESEAPSEEVKEEVVEDGKE